MGEKLTVFNESVSSNEGLYPVEGPGVVHLDYPLDLWTQRQSGNKRRSA